MKIKAHKIEHDEYGCFAFQCVQSDVPYLNIELAKHKPTTLLEIDIQQYKPKRTKKQLGIFWKAFDFYAKRLGINGTQDRHFLYEGFKNRFALLKDSGMVDGEGNPILVPIGLSEANRFEQFEALFRGLWEIMGEEGIDYTPFLRDWENYKQENEQCTI